MPWPRETVNARVPSLYPDLTPSVSTVCTRPYAQMVPRRGARKARGIQIASQHPSTGMTLPKQENLASGISGVNP